MRSIAVVFLMAILCGCLLPAEEPAQQHESALPKEADDRFDDNDTVEWNWNDLAACEGKSTEKLKELCYVNTAPQLKDVSICDRIQAAKTKELCIARVGVATKDSSLCDRVSDKNVRIQCYEAILQSS
jgi:hypothetical protein